MKEGRGKEEEDKYRLELVSMSERRKEESANSVPGGGTSDFSHERDGDLRIAIWKTRIEPCFNQYGRELHRGRWELERIFLFGVRNDGWDRGRLFGVAVIPIL